MKQQERLFGVLQALATSSSRALTLPTLRDKARYKSSKALRADLKILEEKGLIAFQKSGFPSDSHMHKKIVIMNTNIIWVYPREELENHEPEATLPSFNGKPSTVGGSHELPYGIISRSTPLFFSFIRNRKFTEAERIQRDINKLLPKGEFYTGFAMALNGILISTQDRDEEAYVNKIDVGNMKNINRDIRVFKKQIKRQLTPDYDKGYFSAMVRFLKFIKEKEKRQRRKRS